MSPICFRWRWRVGRIARATWTPPDSVPLRRAKSEPLTGRLLKPPPLSGKARFSVPEKVSARPLHRMQEINPDAGVPGEIEDHHRRPGAGGRRSPRRACTSSRRPGPSRSKIPSGLNKKRGVQPDRCATIASVPSFAQPRRSPSPPASRGPTRVSRQRESADARSAASAAPSADAPRTQP